MRRESCERRIGAECSLNSVMRSWGSQRSGTCCRHLRERHWPAKFALWCEYFLVHFLVLANLLMARSWPAKVRYKLRLLPDARCTDREFPSGNSWADRAVHNAVRGRWSGLNRRRKFRRQEGKCPRRGTEHLQNGQEKRNIGP